MPPVRRRFERRDVHCDGGAWKLAGIHTAVDGPFSNAVTGTPPFNAALLDRGGPWEGQGNGFWLYIQHKPADNPSATTSPDFSTALASTCDRRRSAVLRRQPSL